MSRLNGDIGGCVEDKDVRAWGIGSRFRTSNSVGTYLAGLCSVEDLALLHGVLPGDAKGLLKVVLALLRDVQVARNDGNLGGGKKRSGEEKGKQGNKCLNEGLLVPLETRQITHSLGGDGAVVAVNVRVVVNILAGEHALVGNGDTVLREAEADQLGDLQKGIVNWDGWVR
jgi:hypothetical protein